MAAVCSHCEIERRQDCCCFGTKYCDLSYHALGGACDGCGEDEVGALAGLEPGGPVLLLLKVHVQLRDCLVWAAGRDGRARWRRRRREHRPWRRWRRWQDARWWRRRRKDPCSVSRRHDIHSTHMPSLITRHDSYRSFTKDKVSCDYTSVRASLMTKLATSVFCEEKVGLLLEPQEL